MYIFLKKVISETFYSLIGEIIISGMFAFLVWFLGTVLGINLFAFPFLVVWRVLFICLFAVVTLVQVIEVVSMVSIVWRYSRKWSVTTDDVWKALIEYKLAEQEDWQNWDANKFHAWLSAQRIASAIVGGLMKNLKIR